MGGKTATKQEKPSRQQRAARSDAKIDNKARNGQVHPTQAKKDREFVQTYLSANAPQIELNTESSKATLPDMRKPKAPKQRTRAEIEKLVNGGVAVLKPSLRKFFMALQDPFGAGYGARCPINYNPVPTFQSSVAHTSVTFNSFTVPASSATEFALYGGHGAQENEDSMDGVSYHSTNQNIGGTGTSIGPVQVAGFAPCIGLYGNVSLGNALTASSTVGNTPLYYDQALPYSGASDDGGHTRWKLTSMGIRLENTTPLALREGNVVFCQPASQINYGNLRSYAIDPTYGQSTEANVGTFTKTWTPRPQDLAYWHTDVGPTPAITMNGVGFHVWLVNPTGNPQSYAVQIVCNWEVAGQNLVAISSPGIHQPADRNIVEPTLQVAKFSDKGSEGSLAIGTAVAHGATGFEVPPRVKEAAMSHVAKGAKSLVESILGAI